MMLYLLYIGHLFIAPRNVLKRKADTLKEDDHEMEVENLPSLSVNRRTDVDRFQSLKNLRNKVRSKTDAVLRDVISNHTFVGNIDQELALIQHKTSLYIANTPSLSKQLFYQIVLNDFGNFGAIRLNPPAPINALVKLALDDTGMMKIT